MVTVHRALTLSAVLALLPILPACSSLQKVELGRVLTSGSILSASLANFGSSRGMPSPRSARGMATGCPGSLRRLGPRVACMRWRSTTTRSTH